MGETPDANKTLEEMFWSLMPGQRTTVEPRVSNLNADIQAARKGHRPARRIGLDGWPIATSKE